MKYSVTFPQSAGQWAGTHWFSTLRERAKFIKRSAERGAPVAQAVYKQRPA